MTTPTVDYGLEARLNVPYAAAVEKVTAALKAEGFGVLTTIDVKATMKQKIDADFYSYVILGACNPHLAYRALQAEPAVGLLLPCNVIVYEEAGGSVVSIVDPLAMMQVSANPPLNIVAQEAYAKLTRVRDALAAG
jgi:uncharacterized protein (DUF302 family)